MPTPGPRSSLFRTSQPARGSGSSSRSTRRARSSSDRPASASSGHTLRTGDGQPGDGRGLRGDRGHQAPRPGLMTLFVAAGTSSKEGHEKARHRPETRRKRPDRALQAGPGEPPRHGAVRAAAAAVLRPRSHGDLTASAAPWQAELARLGAEIETLLDEGRRARRRRGDAASGQPLPGAGAPRGTAGQGRRRGCRDRARVQPTLPPPLDDTSTSATAASAPSAS